MLVSSTLLGVYRAERNCEKSLFQEWNACRGGPWVGKIVVFRKVSSRCLYNNFGL